MHRFISGPLMVLCGLCWIGFGLACLLVLLNYLSACTGCLLFGFLYSPDGKTELVQNAGDEARQSGWDLTFSSPKSVSVLWSQGSEEMRKEIQAAQEAAVKAALGYPERFAQEELGHNSKDVHRA